MSNNKISIIVASDNHYAILIAALLKSIDINHKTPEHIDFYIIDDGIAAGTRDKLNSIVSPERITIKWIKSNNMVPADISIPVDTSSFPLTAYLRIFAPYAVDQDLDRLIYLDVDTIVQSDISGLWNTDIGDCIMAAAQDPGKNVACEWGGIPNYKELGLSADTMYFNSGVLIIKPKEWREQKIAAQVMEVLVKYKEHVRLADQYGLNVVMANKWKQLDPKWNWFAFQEDVKPYLIHFLDIKPIFTSYNSQPVYKDEFFRYLKMTPWKNFKPLSGHRRTIRKIFTKIKNRIKLVFFKKD
jgi:lipopolysaccharide biosynthesis glycosyltransferase